MKIHVFDILPEKGIQLSFTGDEPFLGPIRANLIADDPTPTGLPQAVTINADLRLDREGKQVTVEGHARATIQPPCARCLKAVLLEVAPEFQLVLLPNRAQSEDGAEIELREDELDEFTYMNDEVDVAAIINEQLLLERPYKVLCMEDCRGLCPSCGTNLNEVASCGCPEQPKSLAFAALADLKQKLPPDA